MKKLLLLLLVLSMVISMAACADKKDKDKDDDDDEDVSDTDGTAEGDAGESGMSDEDQSRSIAVQYVLTRISADVEAYDEVALLTGRDAMTSAAEEEDMTLNEYLKEQFDCDTYEEYCEQIKAEQDESFKQSYGDDYKLTAEDKEFEKLDDETAEAFLNYAESESFEKEDVTAVYRVLVEYKIEGELDSDEAEVHVYLFKIDGKIKALGGMTEQFDPAENEE